MKRKHTRLLAALFAMVLAVTTFAMPVYAASVKKNLITQVKFNYISDGSQTYIHAYKYNKKGLVTQRKAYQKGSDESAFQVDYKYNSKNLLKSATIKEGGAKTATVTYTYNSKKKITKRVTKYVNVKNASVTTKYTYKSGKLKSAVSVYKNIGWHPDGKRKTTYTVNKKGWITKEVIKDAAEPLMNQTRTFKYDKKGFLKTYGYTTTDGKGSITRKLTYKNGVLKKFQDTDHYQGMDVKDNPRTVVSKKASVPKKVSKTIANQQHEIINGIDIHLGYDYL